MNRKQMMKALIDSGGLSYESIRAGMAAIYSQALVDSDAGYVITTPEQIFARVDLALEQELHTGPAPL